jgi:aspartate racemase
MLRPLTIGIVGGAFPVAMFHYDQQIGTRARRAWDGPAAPQLVGGRAPFQQYLRYLQWQHLGAWEELAFEIEQECEAVAAAGADFAILPPPSLYEVLPLVHSPIPIYHILDAVTDYAQAHGLPRLALAGPRLTGQARFYVSGLRERGVPVLLPTDAEQRALDRLVYTQIIRGRVTPALIRDFAEVARSLAGRGAAGILLTCAELELLARDQALPVPVIDGTRVHLDLAWEIATGKRSLVAS